MANLLDKPQFLTEKQLRALKRDTCIFCNEGFKVQKKEQKTELIRRGDYYDHTDYVLVRNFNVVEPDIYSFIFDFDEKTQGEIQKRQLGLVAKLKDKREKDADLLRQRLRETIKLQGRELDLAVNAVVEDYLAEIREEHGFGSLGARQKSKLEQKIGILFHNLQLGDLQLVWDTSRYCSESTGLVDEEGSKPTGIDCVHTYYSPVGLKSHVKCWPFKHFYGSVSFNSGFIELFNLVRKNQMFGDYEALFKDFQEELAYMQDKQITIKSNSHNLTGGFL